MPADGRGRALVKAPDGSPLKEHAVAILPAQAPRFFTEHTVPRFLARTDAEAHPDALVHRRLPTPRGGRRDRVRVHRPVRGGRGPGRDPRDAAPGPLRRGRRSGRAWAQGPGARPACGHGDQHRRLDGGQGRLRRRRPVRAPRRRAGLPFARRFEEQYLFHARLVGLRRPGSGQRVEGVVLDREKQPRAMPPDMARFMRRQEHRSQDQGKEIDWVEGDIHDAQGRGVGGASVYVLTAYDAGMRMMADSREATADGDGHFHVRGPSHAFTANLTIVVHAKDRPPAVTTYSSPDEDSKASTSTRPDARRQGGRRVGGRLGRPGSSLCLVRG